MDSPLLGVVLDSSVLIAAERHKLTPTQVVESVQQGAGLRRRGEPSWTN
jgi:hypothetical protein